MSSKFEEALASILKEASQAPTVKVASLEERTEKLTGVVAKSLVKVASELRNIKTEPTYSDIEAFIRGKDGH